MLHYNIISNDKSREWLVLLHGLGGNSNIWYKQIDTFKEKFNILSIDFRGHGKSVNYEPDVSLYTPKLMCDDILKIMDYLKIEKAHFMAISLGTIVLINFSIYFPEKVKSMVLAGAALNFTTLGNTLMLTGKFLRYMLPHNLLYNIFACIILPRQHHKKSRDIFIREAKLLSRKEFLKWYTFTTKLHQYTKEYLLNPSNKIPTLFVMGDQDYMFLPKVKGLTSKSDFLKLHIIDKCGHVCNIEKWRDFNSITLEYYDTLIGDQIYA